MTDWLTVLTTTDSPEKAQALARVAVEARVAACAQIAGPVTSVYRWRGEVEAAQEWQVLFKTTAARYDALEACLRAAHDYETPEIIATPVVRGDAAYLRWIEEETARDAQRDVAQPPVRGQAQDSDAGPGTRHGGAGAAQ
ncbi:divalent-cation tolerance protein CutA [Streptomyces sp. UH6]|nr:divalent-cation tolerance protein CutA [Streptomyces sp. UH6]